MVSFSLTDGLYIYPNKIIGSFFQTDPEKCDNINKGKKIWIKFEKENSWNIFQKCVHDNFVKIYYCPGFYIFLNGDMACVIIETS